MRNYILILLLNISSIIVFANSVEGIVYESTEEGKLELIGANVYWLNTQIGTTTDFDGKFSLEKIANQTKLVISYIGLKSDTIDISNFEDDLEIVLKSNTIIDEVVVTKRRKGTTLNKMSALQTTTLSGAELCKAACCNLAESFTTNASIDVNFSDAVTGARQIQMLGLSGLYVQLLTENMPNYYGLANKFGMEYIPGSWMSSIQISKGASSVINGYEAMTGQINVEYKKPQDSEELFINSYLGSNSMKELNVNSSFKLTDKLSYMFFVHGKNNHIKMDENNDGFLDMPLINQYSIFNRWNYEGENVKYQGGVKYVFENRNGGQESYDFDMPNTKENGYGIQNRINRVEIYNKLGLVDFADEYTSIGLQTSLNLHKQESFYGLTNYDADQLSFYANLIFQSQLFNENHKYSTGISFKTDVYNQTLSTFTKDFDRNYSSVGTFFQYTYNLAETVNLIAGMRYDYHNEFSSLFTPRLNIKYDITESTILRASLGKGYRISNPIAENISYFATSKEIKIDDNLDKEESLNWGLNLHQEFQLFGKKLSLNLDYYRTDFQSQIIADLDENKDYIRITNLNGDSYSNNYQAELIYDFLPGLQTLFAYRYTDVNITTGGELKEKALTNRYKVLATLSYRTPLDKWQFDLTNQYNGGGRMPEFSSESEFDPYNIVNIQITKRFRDWEVYVGSENLFDFTQSNPVLGANRPFSQGFDATQIWGPVHGRKTFIGMRYTL